MDRHVGRPLTTKGAAEEAADEVRTAIRRGAFPPPAPEPTPPPQTADAVTLDVYADIFLERYSKARQKASWRSDQSILKHIADFALPGGGRLGKKPIGTITEDDVEACLADLRDCGRAASTRNKYLQTFKVLSSWGLRKGYLTRAWFGPLSDLKREKHAKRDRRLQPGEEPKLLHVAAPRLYRLTVAALETGCREGELLSLQFKDLDAERRELRVRARNAKNRRDRYIPISSRLQAVLDMGTHDPAGHPFGPDDYVFGNEVGRRISSPKKAWETAVLKSHGHTPTRRNGNLAPESSAAYREIDLHFHDLRHEAGSRWLEAGMPLHHIKELLGHANIATTDTYLNAGRMHLQASMERVELLRKSGKKVANSLVTDTVRVDREQTEQEGNALLH